MLTLLVQAPDRAALKGLLARPEFREFADQTGCQLLFVEDGQIVTDPSEGGDQ